MLNKVFRKTDKGRSEMEHRSGAVPGALRSVLIMVNGRDSVTALAAARGVPGIQEHLNALLTLGLIEETAVSIASSAPGAVPAPLPVSPQTPSAPPPPSAPAPVAPLALIGELQRQAFALLTPHFGIDTPKVTQPLLAARGASDFNAALDLVQAQLAVYVGRKQAARILAAFRLP
jgi:hypothetical protein